ncbi:hypothetical protein V5799_004626 [Amblyomma americanum]|uniref:CCHC-type domain-containing protein n=1 Tax=Amblyomma americanum TaxID=6943 RepID=A0AAQ4D5K3_AMBAM
MSRPVPNLLKVSGKTVQCEYESVVSVCRKCAAEGHISAMCTAPQCSHCMKFGHNSCDAPCPKCGGDHRVADCTARMYSSVAAVSQATIVPSDTASVVTGLPSESTAAAQEALENSCAGDVSVPAAAPAAAATSSEEGPVAADVTGAEPHDEPVGEDAPRREESAQPRTGLQLSGRAPSCPCEARNDVAANVDAGTTSRTTPVQDRRTWTRLPPPSPPSSDQPLAKRQGVAISTGRFAALAEGSGLDSDLKDEASVWALLKVAIHGCQAPVWRYGGRSHGSSGKPRAARGLSEPGKSKKPHGCSRASVAAADRRPDRTG